jgi:hypothetical protein
MHGLTMILRGLGWDPQSVDLTGSFAGVSDRSLAILAWWLVDRLVGYGVDLAGPPDPAELAAAWAELRRW